MGILIEHLAITVVIHICTDYSL